MVPDSDRQRIKALLTEAIMVLCKNGLSYKTQFCIEGLLGITLDQEDVFLVNIKETIFSGARLQEIEEEKARAAGINNDLDISVNKSQKHAMIDQDEHPPCKRVRHKNRQHRTPPPSHSQSMNMMNCSSPLGEPEEVIVIKEEAPSPGYNDGQTGTGDSADQVAHNLDLSYNSLNTFAGFHKSNNQRFSSQPSVQTMPNPCALNLDWEQNRDQGMQQTNMTSLEALSQVAATRFLYTGVKQRYTPLDSAKRLDIQKAILESDGCVVAARTICRKKNAKIHDVIQSMQEMSVSEKEPYYVGNYREVSTGIKAIRVFYKCPPDKLDASAVEKYNMTLDKYVELYFRSPRPLANGPSNWPNYVEMLMRYCPSGPLSFPLDTMGLDELEKQTVLSHLGNFCPPKLDEDIDKILAVEDQS